MPKTKLAKKKQSGKVKRTLTWFKPTTPAKGMLLFAIVFAVAGGGYALKKSLAGTYSIYPGGQLQARSTATTGTDCSGNKGCVAVVRLPQWSADVAQQGYGQGEILIPPNYPRTLILCTMARAQLSSNSAPVLRFQSNSGNLAGTRGSFSSQDFLIPKDGIFHEYCIPLYMSSGTYIIHPVVQASDALYMTRTSQIYVASMTVKW